jgi:hypothetical protein
MSSGVSVLTGRMYGEQRDVNSKAGTVVRYILRCDISQSLAFAIGWIHMNVTSAFAQGLVNIHKLLLLGILHIGQQRS